MNRAVSAYRSQQVETTPEQQAALLMEAGQIFIVKAIKAIDAKEYNDMAKALSRVAEIINEALFRLNHEEGGALVDNLVKIYGWWTSELMEVGATRDTKKLMMLYGSMGELRSAWDTKAKQM